MGVFLLACFFLQIVYNLSAQNLNELVDEKYKVYSFVEKQPDFQGGEKGMQEFLRKNIRYPESAMRKNISGLVVMTFIVKTDGTVDSIKVAKRTGSALDEEARRIAKLTNGKWSPAINENKPVNYKYTLPIRFSMEGGSPVSEPSTKLADKETLALIEKAHQANEFYNEGISAYEAGKLEEAKTLFTKAIGVKPDHIPALQNRGVTKYKLKDLKGACEDWQQITKLGEPLPEFLAKLCL